MEKKISDSDYSSKTDGKESLYKLGNSKLT